MFHQLNAPVAGDMIATVKTNIVQAVSAVTGLATYKVQVFKMSAYNLKG